jgi:hypothetical protein
MYLYKYANGKFKVVEGSIPVIFGERRQEHNVSVTLI